MGNFISRARDRAKKELKNLPGANLVGDVASVATLGATDALNITDGPVKQVVDKAGAELGVSSEDVANVGLLNTQTAPVTALTEQGADVVSNVWDDVTGVSAAEKQKDAVKEAQRIQQETTDKVIALVDENKDEINRITDELEEYARGKDEEIYQALVGATGDTRVILLNTVNNIRANEEAGNNEVANILSTSLRDAAQFYTEGLDAEADAMLNNLVLASDAAKRGETEYATSVVTGIDNAAIALRRGEDEAAINIINGLNDSLLHYEAGEKAYAEERLAGIRAAADTLVAGETEYANEMLSAINSAGAAYARGEKAYAREAIKGIEEAGRKLIQGERDYARQMIDGINQSTDTLIRGEVRAANEQIKAINNARTTQELTRTMATETFTPWIKQGQWASQELENRYTELTRQFTLDDFYVDPGYNFRVEQGNKAIINAASAMGVTGNAARDLVKFNQQAASDEFARAHIRFRDFQDNVESYLFGMSDRGLTAGQSYANIIERVNAGLTDLDLAEGDVLANSESNQAIIRAKGIEDRSRVASERDLNISRYGADVSERRGEILGTTERNIGRNEAANAISRGEVRGNLALNRSNVLAQLAENEGIIRGERDRNIEHRTGDTSLSIGEALAAKSRNIAAVDADQEIKRGEVLGTRDRNIGYIDKDQFIETGRIEGARQGGKKNILGQLTENLGQIEAQRSANRTDIQNRYQQATGGIESGYIADMGQLDANRAERQIARATGTAGSKINALNNATNAIIGQTQQQGNINAQTALALGDINAGITNAPYNFATNMFKNFLFLKYGGAFGGPGGGGGNQTGGGAGVGVSPGTSFNYPAVINYPEYTTGGPNTVSTNALNLIT